MSRKIKLSLYVAFLVSMMVHLILFNAALNAKWVRKMFAEAPGKDFFMVQDVIPGDPRPLLPDAEVSIEDLISFMRSEEAGYEEMKVEQDREKLVEERDFIPFDASEEEIYDSIKGLFEHEEVEKSVGEPVGKDAGTSIAQEIIAIEENILGEQIGPAGWTISSAIPRGKATADFVYIRDTAFEAGGGIAGGDVPIGTDTQIDEEFFLDDQNIPSIIKPPVHKAVVEIETSEIEDTVAEDIAQIRKYSPLDEVLTVSLYTYREPGDPVGFFEIIIKPVPDREDFEIVPKDIVFIIDSSNSIGQTKLNEYVEGLRDAVSRLNDEDRFNIVEFKNYVRTFSDHLLPATSQNIDRGRRFLAELESSGGTDVYQAFAPFVGERPSEKRPYVLMLVTDGRPTSGIVVNREIINNLTEVNRNKASIYAFAGGRKVNQYLLDLLTYRNKGASRFERRTSLIATALKSFTDEIQDPILINLRYNFAGLNTEKVYPKVLPDFFLGSKIVIMGRYRGEGVFTMQLLGEANGVQKEYVFQQQLTPEVSGSRDVARLWAFRKIYYLIGKMVEEGESEVILAEIRSLSEKFDIPTPYH